MVIAQMKRGMIKMNISSWIYSSQDVIEFPQTEHIFLFPDVKEGQKVCCWSFSLNEQIALSKRDARVGYWKKEKEKKTTSNISFLPAFSLLFSFSRTSSLRLRSV